MGAEERMEDRMVPDRGRGGGLWGAERLMGANCKIEDKVVAWLPAGFGRG